MFLCAEYKNLSLSFLDHEELEVALPTHKLEDALGKMAEIKVHSSGAWKEKAQLVKCLPSKHKDLSWIS